MERITEPSTPEEIKEFMTARRSGKTRKAAEKKVKVIDAATKKAIQEMQIASYFSRLRSDSPRRWLKRLMKPREFRYQSLLRAAMASKTSGAMCYCECPLGCVRGCPRLKAKNERRRIRQGRATIYTVRSARVVVK